MERRIGVGRPWPGSQGLISGWMASDTTAALGFSAQNTLIHRGAYWSFSGSFQLGCFDILESAAGTEHFLGGIPEEALRKSLSAM